MTTLISFYIYKTYTTNEKINFWKLCPSSNKIQYKTFHSHFFTSLLRNDLSFLIKYWLPTSIVFRVTFILFMTTTAKFPHVFIQSSDIYMAIPMKKKKKKEREKTCLTMCILFIFLCTKLDSGSHKKKTKP